MRLLLLFLGLTSLVLAQEQQAGVVNPAIETQEFAQRSYALYLPESYNVNQNLPLVLYLDPSGKGAAAAQRFSIGANKTNSIIVAPNFIFSQELDLGIKELQNFLSEILKKYPIDTNKVIIAGADDGALFACGAAHLVKNISGVIAINEVFIDENVLRKNGGANFVLINEVTAATFYKMKAYEDLYSFRESLKGYYEYNAASRQPEAGYLAAALTDLLMPKDASTVQQLYDSELAFGTSLYKRRKHLEAYDYVNDLKKQYKKAVDLDGQKELIKTIRASNGFKVKRLQRNEARYEEILLLEDFSYFLEEDTRDALFDNLGWWNSQMDALDVKIDSTATNEQERISTKRLKHYIQRRVEEKYELMTVSAIQQPEKLLFINILRTLVNPNNQDAFIQTIALSAKEGDENAVLFYLEELLRSGYTDMASLYTIDGTSAIRLSKAYNEIIKAYLGSSKYYNE